MNGHTAPTRRHAARRPGIASLSLGLLPGTLQAQAPAKAPAGAGAKLVPIPIQLPKPMFEGTPQNLTVPNLQKPLGRPRDPFLAPAGVTNVAKGKKVMSSDMEPVIGEIEQVTDGDKKGAEGSFVELGPGVQQVTDRPGRAARGVRRPVLALPQDAARLLRRRRPAGRRRRLQEERPHRCSTTTTTTRPGSARART